MNDFKPLSQLNAFFKLARERNLCGIDQLVALHINNFFNQAHWTETLLLADAELLKVINWYDKTGKPTSLDSIRKAKARLKKKGFIDFAPGKGNKPTEYRLIQLYPDDTSANTPAVDPSDKELVSYTACAPKTFLDVKTSEEDEAREREQPSDIHDVWEFETGYQLTGSTAFELEALANADFALTRLAIVKAVQSKDTARLRYSYFRKIYDRLKNPPALKGGDSNVQYQPPEPLDDELERRIADFKFQTQSRNG